MSKNTIKHVSINEIKNPKLFVISQKHVEGKKLKHSMLQEK